MPHRSAGMAATRFGASRSSGQAAEGLNTRDAATWAGQNKEQAVNPDVSRSAVLLMDFQRGIVDAIVTDLEMLARTTRVADAARARGIAVIYVVVRLRESSSAVSANNKIFAPYAASGALAETNPATDIHPAAGYRAGEDFLVVKRRVSAFAGSDLKTLLQACDIDTLYLAGVATGGVVLSTLRQAADLDLRLFVLADCCADPDPEVHRVLMDKIFVRQAVILTAEEFATGGNR